MSGTLATPVVLSGRDVRKSFGGTEVLHGITLDVRAGEVLALMGENGAGKSTLISILSGALTPDSGSITVDGRAHRALTPHLARASGIAAIQQEPAVVPDLPIWENLLLGRERRRGAFPRRRESRHVATEWMSAVGAKVDVRRPAATLAPADRQLLEIARARGLGGRVFFFDEPTAVLGPRESRHLFDLIAELARGGAAVVYVSHRLDEVLAITDRVAVLRDGTLVAEGPTAGYDARTLASAMAGRDVGEDVGTTRALDEVALPILELDNLSNGPLRDVSLDVRAGEIHGIAGMVGSSRSRLARLVAGSLAAESGTITFTGRTLRRHSVRVAHRLGIAMVSEDRWRDALFGHMSQAANACVIESPARFGGAITTGMEGRAATPWLDRLSVRPRQPRMAVRSLSGGNQQKVALARALMTQPLLLVLDEPTRGVDVSAKRDIHRAVREVAEAGSGVLVVSSDLPELMALCHRISVLAQGRLVATFSAPFDPTDIMTAAGGGDWRSP